MADTTRADDLEIVTDTTAEDARGAALRVEDAGDRRGLRFERYFTRPDVHPYDELEWELRDAVLKNWRDGSISFEQRDVEFPSTWSMMATQIVSQKYFRGTLGSPERERSVKHMIDRVADTITGWGIEGGYFADEDAAEVFNHELKHLLVHQKAAFNSPVWFNVGVEETPQCSACQPWDAMVSTPDGLVPIGRLVDDDAVGTKVYDAHGVTKIVATKHNGRKRVLRVHVKSGAYLDVTPDHLVWRAADSSGRGGFVEAGDLRAGDRLEWHRTYAHGAGEITTTAIAEAALAGWLQSDGFVGQYEGTNRSLTIEAMTVNDAERAWVLDAIDRVLPGVHRHERAVETQDASLDCRRIRLYGEAPLGDFVSRWGLRARGTEMTVPEHLFTAPLPVVAAYLRSLFQAEGYVQVRERSARIGFDMISEGIVRGVQTLLQRFGIFSRVGFKADAREDRHGCWTVSIGTLGDRALFRDEIGFLDERKSAKLEASLELEGKPAGGSKTLQIARIEDLGETDVYDIQTESGEYLSGNLRVHNCFILSVEDTMSSILNWYVEEGTIFKGGSGAGINLSTIRSSKEQLKGGGHPSGPVSFMRGADASAGTIRSGGKTRRAAKMVILNVDHPDVEEFIWTKAREEDKVRVLREAGFDMDLDSPDYASIQYQNANNSVRVTDEFMRAYEEDREYDLRAVTTGEVVETRSARDIMRQISEAAWQCADPGVQYDTTINDWHTCPESGRINASNPCSEYMHLDNSACNLASLNLKKFYDYEAGRFDVEAFERAVEIVFTAQEIIVGFSSYPTEAIGKNAIDYRELGLGYANLGGLLMSIGLPYDSDEGRAWCGAITALMTGHAYRTSAEIAKVTGPFNGYKKNEQPMLRVIGKHRDAVEQIDPRPVQPDLMAAARHAWDEALEFGREHGYRNSQASVLAPTGCLVGGSLVTTDRGLVRLRSLGDPAGPQRQEASFRVDTDEGPRDASHFYVNGLEAVVTVDTARGYRIQGTPTHRIKVVADDGTWQWRRFGDIAPGDRVPLKLGSLVGSPNRVTLPPLAEAYWTGEHHATAPREVTPELAELVGYFMGDGSLHARGVRLCVAAEDLDVVERLKVLGKELFNLEAHVSQQGGYTEVAFHSVRLVEWWEAVGFAKHAPQVGHSGKGWEPHVPDPILHSNDRAVYTAFVRGLFEADGTVTVGYPNWSTTSLAFSHEVQTLLLSLGYPTTRKMDRTGWGDSDLAVLRVLNSSYHDRWLDEIGFLGARKNAAVKLKDTQQSARHDHIPVPLELVEELAPAGSTLRSNLLQGLRRGKASRTLVTELHELTGDGRLGHLLGFFYDEVASAELGEDELTYDLSVPDNVTYVANGFVSHNTIGLMMDCDTTGIEPDLGLVKTKKMVGGGSMTIVNQTVPQALEQLGYTEEQIEAIVAYIDENKTIHGAPALRDEHKKVFQCAMGDDAIHYMGHVKMMAAAQPFISGALSKTVNLPEEATVEDVEQLHLDAWKLGIKAIAIYRDNCKVAQPLSITKKGEKAAPEAAASTVPMRRKLPKTRPSQTISFRVGDAKGYVTAGEYPGDGIGEIFVKLGKQGSTLSGLLDAFAISVSIGLQYGVPLESYVSKFMNMRFEPAGMTDDEEIRFATSLVDYMARKLAIEYLPYEKREELGIFTLAERTALLDENQETEQAVPTSPSAESVERSADLTEVASPAVPIDHDAPMCFDCGIKMQRAGACYVCNACGTTSGCS
jgi:ribonucleoside-diphosphate reductase alpha chain